MAKVLITGDAQKLLQEQEKIIAQQKKMEGRYKKVGKAGKKAGKDAGKAFGVDALSGAKALVTGLVGAGGVAFAVRLVRDEIAQLLEVQAKIGERQITTASARKDLIRNLVGKTQAEITGVLGSAGKISRETGVEERFIAKGLANALSASGGDITSSEAAVKGAAKFLSDKPEAIPGFAGSLLDLAKVTGTNDADVNLGFLQAVGGLSRVVDPAQQALNIPRSLINQMAFGSTARGGAALFSALSVGSGDIRGSTSGSGSVRLAEQLREELPELQTTEERIKFLQAEPARAKKFLETASFEVTIKGAIEQLLSNLDSEVAKEYLKNLSAIGTNKELGAAGRQAIENFNLDPLERNAKLSRILKQGADDLASSALKAGTAGITRTELFEALRNAGLRGTQEKIAKLGFEKRTLFGDRDVLSATIALLEERTEKLGKPQESEGFRTRLSKVFGTLFIEPDTILPGKEQFDQQAILRNMVDRLEKLVESMDRAAGAMEETSKTADQPSQQEVSP